MDLIDQSELQDILSADATQEELFSEEEMESRICDYQASGNKSDYYRLLSCLRMVRLYRYKSKGEKGSFIYSCRAGEYYPLITSKKQITAEEKSRYDCSPTTLMDVSNFLKEEKGIKGLIINYRSNHLIIDREVIFSITAV